MTTSSDPSGAWKALSTAYDSVALLRKDLSDEKANATRGWPSFTSASTSKPSYGISGLIAIAGLTIGSIVAYISDSAIAWARHWLKLD
ncbi:hypothetical protein ATY76_06445 [Rhizobium sp. R339]|nr:hypothetical protein ATY76_06445 [Rhizobium sp. R339]